MDTEALMMIKILSGFWEASDHKVFLIKKILIISLIDAHQIYCETGTVLARKTSISRLTNYTWRPFLRLDGPKGRAKFQKQRYHFNFPLAVHLGAHGCPETWHRD
jgi:hypothetical protein